jgi:hypothetical protein
MKTAFYRGESLTGAFRSITDFFRFSKGLVEIWSRWHIRLRNGVDGITWRRYPD